MNKKDFANIVLIGYATILTIVVFIKMMNHVEEKQNRYESEMQQHVLQMWGDGRNPGENHICEYGDWCTSTYAEFLENNKSKIKE